MRALRWLFFSRSGLLSIWLSLALVGLLGAVYWHVERQPIFTTQEHWWQLAGATAIAVLPALLLTLDSPDNYSRGPRIWLPMWTLLVLLGLAAWAAADRAMGWNTLVGADGSAARTVFFVFFATALFPRFWNAANFARYDADRRSLRAKEAREAFKRQQLARYPHAEPAQPELPETDQDAESVGALVATIVIGSIGYLAFIAGDGAALSLQSSFGFVLCFAVIGVFVAVVCVDAFSELGVIRDLSHSLRWLAVIARPLAIFYEWIDTILVRLGAAMVGMGHQSTSMRYGVLVGTMTALAFMGWYLPPPYGLGPAFLGFVFAISVSRLWNWVEEDRALAAMTEYNQLAPYRLDFREDFKDETLLAFAFVFLFAPIAMMQANDGGVFGEQLFDNARGRDLAAWVGFFGIELAKAIPVVDWAEIYGVSTNSEMIAIDGPASRHAVFLARVMVDLVLIAALLQTVSIWTRSRQQKLLYKSGHIDRLDPFVERVELGRAIRAARVNADTLDLAKLGSAWLVDFRRYDDRRLVAIYASTADPVKRDFIEKLANQRGLTLLHPIELSVDIAENSGDPIELATTFQRAVEDHHQAVHAIEPEDLYRILTALRTRRGLRSLKEEAVDLMLAIARPEEVIELLSGLADGPAADHYQYAREYMAEAIAKAKRMVSIQA